MEDWENKGVSQRKNENDAFGRRAGENVCPWSYADCGNTLYQSSLELIPFPANIESLLFLPWNPHEIIETNKNPTFLDQT